MWPASREQMQIVFATCCVDEQKSKKKKIEK